MARLYTYAEAPVRGLVRRPKSKYMAAAYVAGLPEVGAVLHTVAMTAAQVAESVLAAHVSTQGRSSNPRIEVVKGDRTDWHVNMVVDFDGDLDDAWVPGWSIEFGRRGYIDRLGRRQPPAQGIYALTAALAAFGGG